MQTPILLSRVALCLSAVLAVAACREAPMPELPAPPVSQATPVAVEPAPGTPPPKGAYPELAGLCNIEQIDDLTGTALDGPVRVQADSTVSGWRASATNDGSDAEAWLRVSQADGTVAFQTLLAATEDRPDVAAFLNRPDFLRSGFRGVAVTGLPAGVFTLEILLESGDSWVRCSNSRAIEVE